MSQVISIKLTHGGLEVGPFSIHDQDGNLIAENVSRKSLIIGVSFSVADSVTMVTLTSAGDCNASKTKSLSDITKYDYAQTDYTFTHTTCVWRHLKNPTIYNYYYGKIEPYIIEYPFGYKYYDEILQNVKDYTKVYYYLPWAEGVSDDNAKVETDRIWFNKAVVYNGQQSSGLLVLIPKPVNDLKEYLSYPKYNTDSKTIIFTKSDNFYQYNTFWSVVKDKTSPLFLQTCESMSIDKVINQTNMDYTIKSYTKEPLRAKELKVRHILDDRYDAHLVSQFIYTPAQNSYK